MDRRISEFQFIWLLKTEFCRLFWLQYVFGRCGQPGHTSCPAAAATANVARVAVVPKTSKLPVPVVPLVQVMQALAVILGQVVLVQAFRMITRLSWARPCTSQALVLAVILFLGQAMTLNPHRLIQIQAVILVLALVQLRLAQQSSPKPE